MMETSIVQLMLLQFHSFYQTDTVHSLNCLAKHFGTSTNKLMTMFKKTFGKSLFEYISELKMDMAHSMLQEKGKMVVEVARITGYKNPNHFSTAFKKRFGVSPSQVG